jgi:mono/diheme cytochrome c family protein
MKRFFPTVMLAFAISVAGHAQTQGKNSRDRGRNDFEAKGCRQCHSMQGVGGHKGPALDDVGKRLKTKLIEQQVLNGGAQMPPFADALSAEEAKDLVKFLHKSRKRWFTASDR